MSYEILEKPIKKPTLSDWHASSWEIRSVSSKARKDGFNLRYDAHQLRNEAHLQSKWENYLNNSKIQDRITEVKKWPIILGSCLEAVKNEINIVSLEREKIEKELEKLAVPISITTECIGLRDSRKGNDNTMDEAYEELIREMKVFESLKQALSNKSLEAWEQINKLKEREFKLQLDYENKSEAITIDEENLKMDRNSAGTSFKPDPLRLPKNCIPYETWIELSDTNKLNADNEIMLSMKLRESLFVIREKTKNDIKAQIDATDYALRSRIYETQKVKNELEYQRVKMIEEMDKIKKEIANLEEALNKYSIDNRKLAETRLENRMFRLGPELVEDPGQLGLKEEVIKIKQIGQDLTNKIDEAKIIFNQFEDNLLRLDEELENKHHAMMTDLRLLDVRKGFRTGAYAEPATQTEYNFKLTKMEEELP